MTTWKCLPCVIERKGTELQGVLPDDAPPIRDAVTLLNGVPHCYEHIAVQRQSPLALPINGSHGA